MSSFSRFQDLNKKRGIANQKSNAQFIFNGYPTISIQSALDAATIKTASVVNRQEKDLAYIYTHIDEPLEIGSVWGAKGLNWLISEEIITIKDVDWHKYLAFLCNTEVDGQWGYFISPEKSYINVTLKQEVALFSQQKPMLVLGGDPLQINQKFYTNKGTGRERVWMVQEKDSFQSGITYYSLRSSTMSKNADGTTEVTAAPQNSNIQADELINISKFYPNQELTFSTEDSYFKTTANINIISINAAEVRFSVPVGINKVTFEVKQENEIVEHTITREI